MGRSQNDSAVRLVLENYRLSAEAGGQQLRDAQIEFLVKLRDVLNMATEAVSEYIDMLSPPKSREERAVWNPENIVWTEKSGYKGPYEYARDLNSLDFRTMLNDIVAHKGKLTRDGLFYWIYGDGKTVGRKKRAQDK